ncbi:MAG: ATP-binding protein, partial [Paracoccaceae bacterium]
MRFSFRATESLVAQSLVRVRMFLDDNMLSASDAETVELVLGEALNNSVEHALAGINGATVDLEIACQDRSVICLIRDRGRPMPPGTMEKDHP